MLVTLTRPGTIEPNRLAIDHISLDYQPLRIEASDSLSVRIQTATDPEGVYIPVPVFRPGVRLSALPQAIQAFGLATTTISVAATPGAARTDTVMLQFTSTDVRVRPPRLRLVPGGESEATVRSGTPGRHRIAAEIDGMPAGSVDVTFLWPLFFLSAAAAGVVLGGAATFFGGKRARRSSALPRIIVKGAPFGLLTAVAGALGLDWLGLHLDDPGTWTGVMLTAALGAWAGRRILDKATPPGAARGA
jgi:hypothetical protein